MKKIMNRIEVLEKVLVENIERLISNGGTLICGSFGDVKSNCACPMSAISVYRVGCLFNETIWTNFLHEATGFEFSVAEIWDFIFAFDGERYKNNQFSELGKRLREKYKPSEFIHD